jgi:hypothetical protein
MQEQPVTWNHFVMKYCALCITVVTDQLQDRLVTTSSREGVTLRPRVNHPRVTSTSWSATLSKDFVQKSAKWPGSFLPKIHLGQLWIRLWLWPPRTYTRRIYTHSYNKHVTSVGADCDIYYPPMIPVTSEILWRHSTSEAIQCGSQRHILSNESLITHSCYTFTCNTL